MPKLAYHSMPIDDEGTKMSHRLGGAAATVALATILTACGGNSGTHTQSFSPSPSDPVSTSISSAPQSSSSSRSSTSSGLPTPTVTPPAQGAVNAYIGLQNALSVASRDPKHADLAGVNKYLSGTALTLFDQSLKSMASAGQAYRGTPASPRVTVQSVVSSSFVFLTNCPLASSSDPFIRYDVKTGSAITAPTQSPPPPYLETLPMKKVGSQWKLTDFIQNTSKTCTG